MLKFFFSFVLILVFFGAVAQGRYKDYERDDRIFYIDGSLGLGDGGSIAGNFSLGYHINSINAIGLSGIAAFHFLSDSYGIPIVTRGFGLQYRATPLSWLILKFEVGYVADVGYKSEEYNYYIYNKNKSGKVYYRGSVALRFDLFTIELSKTIAPNSVFDNLQYPGGQFLNESSYYAQEISLKIGFAIDSNTAH